MSRTIMLIPTATDVGLTTVSLGLVSALKSHEIKLKVFTPVSQTKKEADKKEQTTAILSHNSTLLLSDPFPMEHVESLLSSNQKDVLMEEIVGRIEENKKDADIILVEGMMSSKDCAFANELNYSIAKALGAEIIFITALGDDTNKQFARRIEILSANVGSASRDKILGVIVNKFNSSTAEQTLANQATADIYHAPTAAQSKMTVATLKAESPLPILGVIPWNLDLCAYRVIDIADHLDATMVNDGDRKHRRIKHISFYPSSISNAIAHMQPDTLLVIPSDRPDIVVPADLVVKNGFKISAILLSGEDNIDKCVWDLYLDAFGSELPILKVKSNAWQTSIDLQSLNSDIPLDDKERIDKIQRFVADHIDNAWIKTLSHDLTLDPRMSPPAFRYRLTELARNAHKTIVLPEGNEPRTIKAAAICAERKIAKCILLGDPEEIRKIAAKQGITLGQSIDIVDPDLVREKYVPRLVELRKSKGMTDILAREQLADNVVLGTMMLEQNEVDGLVSGAVHTTANTIRPPLQIIKTAPGNSLVSSVFFMLMPEQVYIYGDCAINPNPTANDLAEIAIQSADTAIAFGIEPRVAMISYSTGESGQGADVEKVKEATRIAKEKRPNLLLDGPLQYDAAVMADVAKSKAPNSSVAGKANVFIFPDLNTGNTTYKAVQRSADVVSIGPMLQGMRKPVNDLSRGALVDDIVYTIALTAIQATQQN